MLSQMLSPPGAASFHLAQAARVSESLFHLTDNTVTIACSANGPHLGRQHGSQRCCGKKKNPMGKRHGFDVRVYDLEGAP